METVRRWPRWVQVILSVVVFGVVQGIIGGRADAIFVWALPELWRQITLFGGDVLLIAAFASVLGVECTPVSGPVAK
jgi:hypothetical protein